MSSGERHNDYDAFAHGYTQDNDSNATNAYYERPTSLVLLGDVAGQRVLDASFDAVLASLVMHYFQDWGPALAEFRRVLVPGGRLVISTHHPFMDHPLAGGPDYFATYDFTEEWTKGGQTVLMRFWHRPLHAMTDAFRAAGFALDIVAEPQPDPAAESLFPSVYADLRTNPRFLFFRLTAP